MPPKIHDISLPIVAGGVVYPNNPPIEIAPTSSISAGGSSNVSRISFGSHTATHVDAQRHFVDEGWTVDEMRLDLLIGPAMLIRFPDDVMAITAAHLEQVDLGKMERVLFATRNSGFIRGGSF